VHKNALFHGKKSHKFSGKGAQFLDGPNPRWEGGHPLSRPYALGAYGTSTPRLWRGLDAFGASVA